ncbi:MAG: nucleotidyltransferase family protein [SAR324 cluster bacterium]|nr:nucleotidyltransferase family protein [SAR324 cluster bacterium]
MIAAIVLAAGQSTRMGEQNKLLLPIGGTTLIARTVDTVLASQAAQTIVVLGHQAERVRAALAGREVTFVHNANFQQGMATSIHVGIGAVAPGTEGVMICLSDLPLVESAELDRLMAEFASHPHKSIAVPTYQGRRGNPVLFSLRHREEILNVRGAVGGCKSVVRKYPQEVLEVAMPSDGILRDVDTLDDYRAVVEAAPGQAPAD